jgi:lipoate-protein ligase A
LRYLPVSHSEPALNLALDEALLESVARGYAGDTLRVWESPRPFVVLGTGQHYAREANVAQCTADGIPVLRRCSAGGCVLQGPGSINFTVVLRLEDHPEARALHSSYCYILNLLRDSLRAAGCALDHAGTCDLALAGKKVSGNAQRRKREAILHHGTLIYQADYAGMARYLREPEDRPAYRGERTHEDFVGVLPFSRDELEPLIARAYGAHNGEKPSAWEEECAEALALEKYRQDSWNMRR